MQQHFLVGCLLLSLGTLFSSVHSKTDPPDVVALNVMFQSLSTPKLNGWKANGGDPCGESWEGIQCSGTSITKIKLSNHGLNGQLGYQLSSLISVAIFDVSRNNLIGEIPYQLPPNAEYIDLSENSFSGNVPYSISQMTNLRRINLGHNQLKGQLMDMFAQLPKLKNLDLSFNQLLDKLPSSFANLTSLKVLHLQNNQFRGSLKVLADLPLDVLDVENNKFSGTIPNKLKGIRKIKTGGNSWSTGPAPPSRTNHVLDALFISASGVGVIMVIFLLIVVFSRKRSVPSSPYFLDEVKHSSGYGGFSSRRIPVADPESNSGILKEPKALKYLDSIVSMDINAMQKSPAVGLKHAASSRVSFNDNRFVRCLKSRRNSPVQAVPYILADLQNATGNFAARRLLGEGTIGCVHKAKYPDGKYLAVKKIHSSLFQDEGQEQFLEIVTNISKLHHPNITELVGYCSAGGQNILVYDYFRNGSLHGFLHVSDDFSNPLTWNTRIRIALGIARAIEYLHISCSPPMIHKNIKSSNVLLDIELNPHLSDYGMAQFHQRTSQNLGMGYNAPECANPGAYTQKSDIYSFGVVMLELMTGRKPLDSKRPKSEECLVKWASLQLHDIDSLARMVDPALRGLYPLKSLPPFADIIALCVQLDPKRRPPVTEVVQSLVRLVQQSNIYMKEDLSVEGSDYN